jgi:hypothetical protein
MFNSPRAIYLGGTREHHSYDTTYKNIFFLQYLHVCSFNLGVGIATGYGLDDGVRFPRREDFSLFHSVQTDPGTTHPHIQ